jgi:RND family efflux transporter MFP subunit
MEIETCPWQDLDWSQAVKIWMLTPLLAVLAGSTVWRSAQAEAMGCLVEPDRVADVGSSSVGVLERVLVERGDQVDAGQLVAKLSAGVERASVSVAQARSQTDAELRQALASYELARSKLIRARDLLKREFVSGQAVEQAEAEARVAEQRVAQARDAQLVAQRELKLSAEQLGQRDVRSPFSGIVIERYRTEGERIEREPLVRVAKIDPLRVEAIVPASQFGRISAGQMAVVKTDLPSFATLNAKVVLVDRVIDPASNSFRVRLTLPNPDHKIPSGLRCKVDFAGSPANAAPSGMQPTALRPSPKPVMGTPAKASGHAPSTSPVVAPSASPKAVLTQATGAWHSTKLVDAASTPSRDKIKQDMASRDVRLSLTRTMVLPRPSAFDGGRTWLSMR